MTFELIIWHWINLVPKLYNSAPLYYFNIFKTKHALQANSVKTVTWYFGP